MYDSDAENDAAGGASDDAAGPGTARGAADEPGERSGGAGRGGAALDPETVFMQVCGCCDQRAGGRAGNHRAGGYQLAVLLSWDVGALAWVTPLGHGAAARVVENLAVAAACCASLTSAVYLHVWMLACI